MAHIAQQQKKQQQQQHSNPPRLDTAGATQPWPKPQLTSSSLQQLRRGGGSAEDDERSPQVTPMMSRKSSVDSDRFSAVSTGLASYFPSNPTNVNPRPAYVAQFGASQVVSEDFSARLPTSEDEDDEDKLNKDDVHFSDPALALVNAFLDQLLYSVLSTARSTSLSSLRPAVTEVLKHRLARDAIASAEEEMAELLAGGEDEEEDARHKKAEDNRHWDLELVWKRTRLRVMVYMRLGEMEDEDEQRYVKEEQLFHGSERRFSQSSGLVSWAAAIFLTSVLEYVAEQTLQVAGQAAYTRARRQSRARRLNDPTAPPTSEELAVEEHDVEKVALNSTLGRLWRTWRKSLRNNTAAGAFTHRSPSSMSRTSREDMVSAMSHQRGLSTATYDSSVANDGDPMSRDIKEEQDEIEHPEHVLAANIPLPMGDSTRDVDEIVVPGLARDLDDEQEDSVSQDEPYPEQLLGMLVALPMVDEKRDVDEIEVPGLARDPDAVIEDMTSTDDGLQRRRSLDMMSQVKPPMMRQRSRSLPLLAKSPMLKEAKVIEDEKVVMEDGKATQDAQVVEAPAAPATPEAQGSPKSSDFQTPMESPSRGIAHKSKTESPWIAAGAGAAAIAATGAAAVGSRKIELQHNIKPSGQSTALPTYRTNNLRPVNQKESGEPIDSASLNGGRTDAEIEELDKRKSTLDIKEMMRDQDLVDSRGSAVSEHEGPHGAIGVARTAETAPRGSLQEIEAREGGRRPARLNLATGSPTIKQAATMQQQFVDSSSDKASQSPGKASRASPTNGVQQSPSADKTSPRQLSTGVFENHTQKMAAAPKSPRSPQLVSSESNKGLTSAAIRGPEDFDMFVQGGDTVKYTLTPDNVRDDPSRSPSLHPQSRRHSPPAEMDATSRSPTTSNRAGRSQSWKSTTPSAGAGAEDDDGDRQTTRSSMRGSINRPPTRNTTTSNKTGLMAREPRVLTDSTRDFADFIRSTGPDKESEVQPIVSSTSSASLHPLRSAHINGASASQSSSPGRRNDGPVVPPVPPIPKQNMQPRAAKSVGPSSSELIDFIRAGPEENGKHRIPRTVAPWRSTMDSDQLTDLADRSFDQRSVNASTPSQRTSANSRSALLNGTSNAHQTTQPAYSGRSQQSSQPDRAMENEPAKKRTRTKDPYALDFLDEDEDDDDEDEDFLTSDPKPSRKEESLMDFLNSHEPPSDNAPRPVIDPNSAQARSAAARARRNTPEAQQDNNRVRTAPTTPRPSALSNIAASPAVKARMQARGAEETSNTRELADFLNSSGPPPREEEPQAVPPPSFGRGSSRAGGKDERSVKKKKSGGALSFFSRPRKKTYLDLP